MTGLVRGGGFFFHKLEFIVCSQTAVAGTQYPVMAKNSGLEGAKAGDGAAAVAVGLGRFSGEVRRKQQRGWGLALAQG